MFVNDIDSAPFVVKIVQAIGEVSFDRITILIRSKLSRHGLKGAALDQTELQLPALSYCYVWNVPVLSDFHLNTSILVRNNGKTVSQRIVAHHVFHTSSNSRYDSVMFQSDEVSPEIPSKFRSNHKDTRIYGSTRFCASFISKYGMLIFLEAAKAKAVPVKM